MKNHQILIFSHNLANVKTERIVAKLESRLGPNYELNPTVFRQGDPAGQQKQQRGF